MSIDIVGLCFFPQLMAVTYIKHIDLIAANNLKVAGAGFGVDTNVLTLITRDSISELPMMSKEECADMLLDRIMEMRKAADLS